MADAIVYRPVIGALPGKSFETQTVLFLQNVQDTAKNADDNAAAAFELASGFTALANEALAAANDASQAASDANTTAQQALDTANQKSNKVELKGTATTTGTWVISSLEVGKPLYIVTQATYPPDNAILPIGGAWGSGACLVFIPTNSVASFNVPVLEAGTVLRAYQ